MNIKFNSAGHKIRETFTKEDTNAVKGIAIVCMVFHHVYPNITYIPVNRMESVGILGLIAVMGKVCVALLTLISGYGMAKSYSKALPIHIKNKIRFVSSHYVKLISWCWFVFLWSVVIQYWLGNNILVGYGSGKTAGINLFTDLIGIAGVLKRPTILGDWYYTAIVVFYVLYPVIDYLIDKLKILFLFFTIMPWIPWTLKYIFEITKIENEYNSDQWMYYLFSFAFGVYLSKNNILDKKMKEKMNLSNVLISLLVLLIAILLRAYITIPMDLLLSYSIVLVYIYLVSYCDYLRKFLAALGAASAYMWLVHGIIIAITCMWEYKSAVSHFIIVLFFSYATAVVLKNLNENTKKIILVKKCGLSE